MKTEIDHSHTKDIICPYCGETFADSWEYFMVTTEDTDVECGECGREFMVTQHVSVTYSSFKTEEKG